MTRVWQNWEGRFRSRPKHWHEPATVDEVVAIVRSASSEQPVKVVGAGHSWSDIALPDVHLLTLQRMNRVLSVNHKLHQVTVEAGISIHELNTQLAELGLGLSNQGSVNAQSIAGAISTGTHGTGPTFGGMATQVLSLKLVTAAGDVLSVSPEENADLWDAVRVGLGALGIVVEVTLQCEPAFCLHSLEQPVPFDTMTQNIQDYAYGAEHCKIWWFPHTEYSHIWQLNRESLEHLPPRWKHWLWWWTDDFLGQRVSHVLLWLLSFLPFLTPAFNRFFRRLTYKRAERTARSNDIFNFPVHIRHPEMEYAIPLEKAGEALQELKRLIEERRFIVNFIVEIRFVREDNIWLSPTYQQDSCYIGVMMYKRQHAQEEYFQACEELFLRYGGRPHWGKLHSLTASQLATLYPKYDDFLTLHNKLDPERILFNDYLRRVLEKKDHPNAESVVSS